MVFLLQDMFYGGTQTQSLELARRLDPARFRVELWLLMAGDDLSPQAQSWGLTCRWLGRGSWVGPDALARLGVALIRERLDLLLLLTGVPNIWGRPLGCLAGVPAIVATGRGEHFFHHNHEPLLHSLADGHVFNAQVLAQRFRRRYPVQAERVAVIPNGVDLARFRPAPEPPAGDETILCPARLVPEKDHLTLLQAFGLLAGRRPSARLALVGDGPLRRKLADLTETLCPPGRVEFRPGQSDLRPLYAQASLVTLSSRQEGLPNVLLEAQACGRPVVATAVGGVPEAVAHGRTGLLVPPGDPVALAGAMEVLLAELGLRRQMGQAGRRRMEERFDLDRQARRWEELFARLLARPARRRRPWPA